MGNRAMLGSLAEVLLGVLIQAGPNTAASDIRTRTQKIIGKEISVGSLYAAIESLEKKRYVSSQLGDPTPERGGRAKRFFTITALGQEVYQQAQKRWAQLQPNFR